MLFTIGNMGSNVSGTPIRRDTMICQKVVPSMTTISTSMLIISANMVPRDALIFLTVFLYPDNISLHDLPRDSSSLTLPTAVSVESLYRINTFAVIITKALIYSIRMAGVSVSLATSTEEIGANRAERLPKTMIHEYMWVILSLGASSISRQFQATCVILIIPLNSAATTKNQKPWLDAQMMLGILHARKSKMAVLFLLPSLSVTAPDRNALIIWENI